MILGRGAAHTDDAIIAEYHDFLAQSGQITRPDRLRYARNVPRIMCQQIGKPMLLWSDADILGVYRQHSPKTTFTVYNAFLAFLLFRGYHCPGFDLLSSGPLQLCAQHQLLLEPWRVRLREAQADLGHRYAPTARKDRIGSVLELLIWFLAVSQKPPEEVTRADFDRFQHDYDRWYRKPGRNGRGSPNPHLYRLEQLLVHLKIIPVKEKAFAYERYFAQFPHPFIREAVLRFFAWCTVKYKRQSIYARRRALCSFLQWLCETHPACTRLDEVTRSIALDYATYLKQWCDEHAYSATYRRQLYFSPFLFFEFAIEEGLETAPARNPFAHGDLPKIPDMVPRYLPDHELHTILTYCERDATLLERTLTITLLHTGIRASELAVLKASDIIRVAGVWKLHIHEGKGLKDWVIPLTETCVQVLHTWMTTHSKQGHDFLFTYRGRRWSNGHPVTRIIREMAAKLGLQEVTPHRFRHTFAVALLNYGVRESALQRLMGHATLGMTLEYARILDETVERSFSEAVERMQEGALSWVPNFFEQQDYTLFAERDAVSWIRLPLGFCRRNPKLHCESDVKCLLCDRFAMSKEDLPRLQQMHERFLKLGLTLKADVVAVHIQRLALQGDEHGSQGFIPITAIPVRRQ
jgi:site-specific recombinase XerD